MIIIVPKVDRGPSDPVNATGVIVDQRNNINRMETQHKLLKLWFDSGNSQLATSNVVNVDQVKKNNTKINNTL